MNLTTNQYNEIRKQIVKITKGEYPSLVDDFVQEVMMIFINHPKANEMLISGDWKFFIIRVAMNQWRSSTSPFHYRNKKNKLIELTEDMDLEDEEYDWEKDHNITLVMDGLDRMYRSENEQDRYKAIIILLYYSTGESYTKLGKTLNLDRTTISKTFRKGIEILKTTYIKENDIDIPTNISKTILDSKLLKEINMKDQGEIYKEWIISNRLIFFNHSLRTREHINEVYKIYNYFMGTNEQPNQCGICVAQKFNYFKELYFK